MLGERVPTVSELGPSGKLEAVALDKDDDSLTESILEIVEKAESNWLKNEEVLAVLEFFQGKQVEFPDQPAYQPNGGKLFLFSRKKCRGFRNDKHNWRKKNDKKTIKETHEKLKVQDQEKLNCYYAHAERDDGLQRRCYWILDKQFDDVVMVHYLCSSTSRVVGRSTPTKSPQRVEAERASLRPRRAASMKTRFSELFQEDSDDLDQSRIASQRRDLGGHGNQIDESTDDLGDPLDSFIAKLPDDFGLNREFSRFDQLPGDLSISANQIARIIETSPSKSPTKLDSEDRYFNLGSTNASLGKMELHGLLDGAYSIQSPKKGLHGTLSDADSLLRGFSRLESLEFLKMVSPDVSLLNTQGYDGHLGSAGVAFVSKANDSAELDKIARSDSYNENHASEKAVEEDRKESQKVSTIRRVVAPGTVGPGSGFESSFALTHDAGMDKHRKAPNPINRNTQKTASARITEAALAATDHNIERRESLLKKVRKSKDPARTSEDDDGLIHPPTLFRSQSHLVEDDTRAGYVPILPSTIQGQRDKSPEKTAVLLKQMSIDEASKPAAEFLRSLSIELPAVDENTADHGELLEGFGSELLAEKSKDPSL